MLIKFMFQLLLVLLINEKFKEFVCWFIDGKSHTTPINRGILSPFSTLTIHWNHLQIHH